MCHVGEFSPRRIEKAEQQFAKQHQSLQESGLESNVKFGQAGHVIQRESKRDSDNFDRLRQQAEIEQRADQQAERWTEQIFQLAEPVNVTVEIVVDCAHRGNAIESIIKNDPQIPQTGTKANGRRVTDVNGDYKVDITWNNDEGKVHMEGTISAEKNSYEAQDNLVEKMGQIASSDQLHTQDVLIKNDDTGNAHHQLQVDQGNTLEN